jgi:hypothetical protein
MSHEVYNGGHLGALTLLDLPPNRFAIGRTETMVLVKLAKLQRQMKSLTRRGLTSSPSVSFPE